MKLLKSFIEKILGERGVMFFYVDKRCSNEVEEGEKEEEEEEEEKDGVYIIEREVLEIIRVVVDEYKVWCMKIVFEGFSIFDLKGVL